MGGCSSCKKMNPRKNDQVISNDKQGVEIKKDPKENLEMKIRAKVPLTTNKTASRVLWCYASSDPESIDTNVEFLRKELQDKFEIVQFKDPNILNNDKSQWEYLVTSKKFAKKKENLLEFSERIKSVIIFDQEEPNLGQWHSNNKKIILFTNDIQNVISKIKEEKSASLQDNALDNIELKASFYFESNKDCINYIFLETLYYAFERDDITKNDQAKIDFLKFCHEKKEKYSKKFDSHFPKLLEDVLSEEIYSPKKVINWYTQETFLYPLINNTFREGNYYNLFKIRFMASLLSKAINGVSFHPTLNGDQNVIFYRGALINKIEYEVFKKNIHKPLLLRGFISTSSNIKIAQEFLTKVVRKEYYKIIFTISVRPQDFTKIHPISSFSDLPEEEEYLFNINTFLSIQDLTKKDDLIEVSCQIITFDECKNKFPPCTLAFKEKFKEIVNDYKPEKNDKFLIEQIYFRIGEYDTCMVILDEIEEEENEEDNEDYLKFHLRGMVYDKKGMYNKALICHEKVLKNQISIIGEKNKQTAVTYNNIGLAYFNQGQYDNALNSFDKSLSLSISLFGENDLTVSDSYNNIGLVLIQTAQYEKALKNCEKSLKIRSGTFGENNPAVAECYNNMGVVYLKKNDFSNAKRFSEKALKIFLQTLGGHHPLTADTYMNFGDIYRLAKIYSLNYYQKAIKIYIAVFGEDHPSTASCYNKLGLYHQAASSYEQALKYYEDSKNIFISAFGENHPYVAMCYSNIGEVYNKKMEFETALNFYNLSLKIRISTLGNNNPETVENERKIVEIQKKSIDPPKEDLEEYFSQPFGQADKYMLTEQKGAGQTYEVYLGEVRGTDLFVAVKILRHENSPQQKEFFENEIKILKQLSHPNIIGFYDSGTMQHPEESEKCNFIAVEYMENGDFLDYVILCKGFSERIARYFFLQILDAVEACHEAGICHGNLKLENIMLSSDWNIKLSGLGFSRNPDNVLSNVNHGAYVAPEIYEKKPYNGFSADIFSCGVFLFHLIAALGPFNQATKYSPDYSYFIKLNYETFWIKKERQSLQISKELKSLLNVMWAYDPIQRPTINEIRNHPWMALDTASHEEVVLKLKEARGKSF